MPGDKVTARRILKMKGSRPIVAVTAYDYPTAWIADEAGVDVILVGDSLGMVVLGYPSTLQVTLDDMVRHTAAVARAAKRPLIVADMPFGSYEPSSSAAVESAVALARVGAEAVKLEGGSEYADRVKAIVDAGIPVMGHLGLTPQRAMRIGGYRPRARGRDEARRLLLDAESLVEAGVFSIVLEFVSEEAAEMVTRRVPVPTICIGSGRRCDGQIIVFHDIVGLSRHTPPFAKKYVDARRIMVEAVTRYAEDVRNGRFPGEEHVVHAKEPLEDIS
ncbi:3-methyl-2-oxobutanoate hydroxymethyltransferase [Aeropyrum pernix K1]|uniref:3-methyl-2-oxobutanoate hydroxymethyltransferase n=1 Tax=Aeropyrum pernix (strain ATCC 700893 / DSM 11879 / JCM 9820 / NBRC 100138 / K1) TaxID=272557 RepID=PANB_AERPE|nr:3-methyl-2-oxobutanoate hydroxymethyltransferase [Aeropyrum pernix]Q9YE97.1 RecName: Full=3-methyl-2-oxobutanoate hydroxymethyltransferase; AltName: Full=Ketopantoate hydroxymethyltransferase; Short=KPHMT [Aeropyrum pernix K1]BAA79649.1 3-methyl-2-oxobutanoate hydroxymethyltransferase [Aeropyrum pernix K1]